jgi:uncharacterized membrane protein YedE/YeeE
MNQILAGLITGIVFGFLLQKGQVLRYEKQLGALRLQDMTIVKFMFSGILVGAVGLHLLNDLGVIESLQIRPVSLGGQLIGGTLFGIGWALFGFCPGTALGALGEGRLHAIPGLLGMVSGAAVFAIFQPFLSAKILSIGQFGRITLPEMLGMNHWLFIILMIAGVLLLFWLFEKMGL